MTEIFIPSTQAIPLLPTPESQLRPITPIAESDSSNHAHQQLAHRPRSKSISLTISSDELPLLLDSSNNSSSSNSPLPSKDTKNESGSILQRWRRKKGMEMKMSIDVPNSFVQKLVDQPSQAIDIVEDQQYILRVTDFQSESFHLHGTDRNIKPHTEGSIASTSSNSLYHTRNISSTSGQILITSIPASHIAHARNISLPTLPLVPPPIPYSFSREAVSIISTPYELRQNALRAMTPSVNVFASLHRPLRFDPLDLIHNESTLIQWKQILSSSDFFTHEINWRSDPSFSALIWKGIPSEYRGIVWPYLLQNTFARADYEKYYDELCLLVASGLKTIPSQADIDKDIHRTLTKQPFFQGEQGALHIQSLRRVLYAYSLHAPAVGYCQGMNFIAGALLINTNNAEALTFACLTSILDKRMSYYTKSMVGSMVDTAVMCDLVSYYEPELNVLLSKYGISVSNFSTSWFICLFLHSPLHFVHCMHFWDLLFYFGEEMIFYMGLAVLRYQHTRIANIFSPEEILTLFLSQLGEIDQWDLVVDYMQEMYEGQHYFAHSVSSLRDYHKYEIMAEMSVLNTNISQKLQSSLFFTEEELQTCWELFIRPKPWETIVTDVISSLTHFRYSFCAAVFKPSATAQWKGRGLILPSDSYISSKPFMNPFRNFADNEFLSQPSLFPSRSSTSVGTTEQSLSFLDKNKKDRLQNLSAQFCLSAPDEAAESIFLTAAKDNKSQQTMFPSPSNTVPLPSPPSSPTKNPTHSSDTPKLSKPTHTKKKSFAFTSNSIALLSEQIANAPQTQLVSNRLELPRKSIQLPSTFSIARVVKHHTDCYTSLDLPSPKTANLYRKKKQSVTKFDATRRSSLSVMSFAGQSHLPLANLKQFISTLDKNKEDNEEDSESEEDPQEIPRSESSNMVSSLPPLKPTTPLALQKTLVSSPPSTQLSDLRNGFCRMHSATQPTESLPSIESPISSGSLLEQHSELNSLSSTSAPSYYTHSQVPLVEPLTSSPFSHNSATYSRATNSGGSNRLNVSSPLSSAVHPQHFLPVGGGENVLARLFTMLDTQNRGCIDFEEFCMGVAIFKKSSRQDRTAAIFRMANRSSIPPSTASTPRNSLRTQNTSTSHLIVNEERISKTDILTFVSMFDRLYYGSRTNNFEVESFAKMAFEKFSHKKSTQDSSTSYLHDSQSIDDEVDQEECAHIHSNAEPHPHSINSEAYLTKDEFCEIIVLHPLIANFFRLDPQGDSS